MKQFGFHRPPAFAQAPALRKASGGGASRGQARPHEYRHSAQSRAHGKKIREEGLVRGTEVTEKFHRKWGGQFFLQSGDTDWRKRASIFV